MSLINFTAEFDLLASQTDSADMGADSDLVALSGTVVFTPEFTDTKPILAPGHSPRAAGVKLRPISGYLDSDGQLKSAPGGAVGVRLPANDEVLELDKLIYRVDFNVRTPSGEKVAVEGGYFEAPDVDSTINLTDVLQPTGAASIQALQQQLIYAHEIQDSSDVGVTLMTAADVAAARAAIGTQTVSNLAALKAISSVGAALAGGYVFVRGFYSAGDGGGGMFRWDSTDTSSANNNGTIVTPTDSGLAATGRWKRVHEGEVNARWFGVNPSQTDNTAALQAAVTYVSSGSGMLYIPAGEYRFKFSAGTSGLSTISVTAWNVTIRGDGPSTVLKVTDNATPSQVSAFFTFSYNSGEFAFGGGVHDLAFNGNSMLKWAIVLHSWQNFKVERVLVTDIHSGVLDAINYSDSYYPNQVIVRDIAHSQPGGAYSQYLVRFRLGNTSARAWTDCYIYNVGGNGVWDTGVVLDGCQRFLVRDIYMSNSASNFTNNIDGVARTGIQNCVAVRHSVDNGLVAGFHVIDGIYMEETTGSASPSTNVAVLIYQSGNNPQIQRNYISNVTASALCGMLKIVDSASAGRVVDTTFVGNRVTTTDNLNKFTIDATAVNTTINLYPNSVTVNAPGATPKVPVEYEEVSFTGINANITSLSSGLTFTPANGRRLRLRFKDDGTQRQIAAGAKFRAVGVALPSITTQSKTLYWDCVYNAADSVWDVVDVGEDGDSKVTAKNAVTLTSKTLTDPKVNQITDTNGNTLLYFTAVSSAKNYLNIINNATGSAPYLASAGYEDTNVGLRIVAGGSGTPTIEDGRGSIAKFSGVASPVNSLTVGNAATTVAPTISAVGETNVGINLVPKGTGTVQANGVPLVTTTGTQTLTSKTLTSPTVTTPVISGAKVNDFQPTDYGFISWTFDLSEAPASATIVLGGYLFVTKIPIPVATTITNLHLAIATGGSGLTSGQCLAGLYQNGNLLASTGNQSTAWTTSGIKTMALSSPQSVSAGYVYIGWHCNGTTSPVFHYTQGPINMGLVTSASNALGYRGGYYGSGWTTAMSTTLGNLEPYVQYWGAVS